MSRIIKKVLCKLFGHKYAIVIYYSRQSQKLQCGRCKKYFGINHDAKSILDWDNELEEVMKIIYPEKSIPNEKN